jgi:hypothetical protein
VRTDEGLLHVMRGGVECGCSGMTKSGTAKGDCEELREHTKKDYIQCRWHVGRC